MRAFLFVLALMMALPLGVAVWADDDDSNDEGGDTIPFAAALIRFEVNDTDGDAGIQVFLDGEPWKSVRIYDPDGERIFEIKNGGSLKEFGLTELFCESNEPPFDEVPLLEVLDLFPEGEYEFVGRTVEGDELVGCATLTHDLPDGPVVVNPEEDEEVDPDDAVIEWNPVTTPAGIDIVAYQVIVVCEDPLRVFRADLPASATSITIPPEFLEPGTEYSFEVLAIEVSGNQTITESSFETE
jgi:hypothetical protein